MWDRRDQRAGQDMRRQETEAGTGRVQTRETKAGTGPWGAVRAGSSGVHIGGCWRAGLVKVKEMRGERSAGAGVGTKVGEGKIEDLEH